MVVKLSQNCYGTADFETAVTSQSMRVRFWGVRGSVPTPGRRTAHVGGNTACIEVEALDETFIFDAGTGIRELGLALPRRPQNKRLHLFLSHTHWDHIQGLPFFRPLYEEGRELVVYGPRGLDRGLEGAVMVLMERLWFPVRRGDLAARISFVELGEGVFHLGPVVISTKFMNHPVLSLAYGLAAGGKRLVYTGDHEPFSFLHSYQPSADGTVILSAPEAEKTQRRKALVDFLSGSGVIVSDAQYTDEEYPTKSGWGHSPVSYAVDLAAESRAEALVLFHHDPAHDDSDLEAQEERARRLANGRGAKLKISLAREGETLEL